MGVGGQGSISSEQNSCKIPGQQRICHIKKLRKLNMVKLSEQSEKSCNLDLTSYNSSEFNFFFSLECLFKKPYC